VGIERFAGSAIGKPITKLLAAAMESRFRYRFFAPDIILRGVDGLAGRDVLEVGCGTGYFTLPAAAIVGDAGSLVAIDILAESVDLVSGKVRAAGLPNVHVMRADALATGFEAGRFDTVLLFGVVPAPVLPLMRLLPEMHRVLRAGGGLAVWPPVPGWLPGSILRTGLFDLSSRRNHVCNFRRRDA
jgi:ubiquinone/menaquinone biosynthesis C-methylase UbiE